MPRAERLRAREIRRKRRVERAITTYLISGPDTLLRGACLAACDPARTVSGCAAVAGPAARSRGVAAVWAV
jgi:hypothetical protein